MFVYLILVLYIVLYIASLYNVKNAIFCYVFFIPIHNLIDLDLFYISAINGIFSIILLFHFIRLEYLKYLFSPKIKLLKRLLLFTSTLIFVVFLNQVRTLLLFQDYSVTAFIYDTIIMLVSIINMCMLMILLITRIKNIDRVVLKAIVCSAVVIVISQYLSPFLDSIGINTNMDYISKTSGRYQGVYGGGDVNSLSTLLNLVISFIIIYTVKYYKEFKLRQILLILFLSTGIFLTGSRMGLITLAIILVYSFFKLQVRHSKGLTGNQLAVIFGVVVLLTLIYFGDRFQIVLSRFSEQSILEEVSLGSRQQRWIGFIQYSFSDLKTLLVGADKIFYVFGGNRFYDPHNFFIRTLYYNGILVTIVLIFFFVRINNIFFKKEFWRYSFLLSLVVIISLMIISQTVFLYYYVLFISLAQKQSGCIYMPYENKQDMHNNYALISSIHN